MGSIFKKYASVLLDIGLQNPLDYGISDEHLSDIQEGMCVEVPLRGSLQTGIILALLDQSKFNKVLPIKKIVSAMPLMTPKLFELAKWMSRYYNCPLAKTLKLFFSKPVRKGMEHKTQQVVVRKKTLEEIRLLCIAKRAKKPKHVAFLEELLKMEKEGFLTELLEKSKVSRSIVQTLCKEGVIELIEVQVHRSPLEKAEYFPTKPKTLNAEQQVALDEIAGSLHEQKFNPFLLHGVTGSGKTEVYLQAIDVAIKKGKTALMLVPEIALTTQTIEKFKSRFKDQIAILHHKLSDGEKFDQWHAIRAKKAPIVIGARSAIFAPLDNIGLIIIDEEHENSYKQTDEMPTYHARDVAVMRAKMEEATVVLGTATPSLESYANVERKKYRLLTLNERVNERALPQFELIDMKKEFEINKGFTLFSQKLLTEIKSCYQKGEQVLLFLNRRGYHTSLMCTGCSEVEKCPHCSISLSFHQKENKLCCHLCDYQILPPSVCRKCRSPTLKFKGVGTENVESQLRKVFPEIRTMRMDADTTKHVGSYEKLYYSFRNHKADVLIGTQMIAKGLHFPNVTLVGILNSDQQFSLPDFKASETSFQMVMQVAGRAGRGELLGKVLVQTFDLNQSILKHAIAQDYLSFYKQEIESRQFFSYPPFAHFVKLVFKGTDEAETLKWAGKFYQKLAIFNKGKIEVQEPVACGYAKVNKYYRFQILVKGAAIYAINEMVQRVQSEVFLPSKIKLLIDVDPISTFF